MRWRDFPSWLKGGIIAILIPIILVIAAWLTYLVFFIYSLLTNYFPPIEVRAFLLAIILYSHFIAFFPAGILFELDLISANDIILTILSSVIVYFLLGAIIGWIIGKIKSKKKALINSNHLLGVLNSKETDHLAWMY